MEEPKWSSKYSQSSFWEFPSLSRLQIGDTLPQGRVLRRMGETL